MDDRGAASRGGVILTGLGALALLLALLTVWQSRVNGGLQRKISENQVKLTQAQAIVTLDNNLVQLLAKSAVETNDADLRELLSQNGVTLKAGATPSPQATGASGAQ